MLNGINNPPRVKVAARARRQKGFTSIVPQFTAIYGVQPFVDQAHGQFKIANLIYHGLKLER